MGFLIPDLGTNTNDLKTQRDQPLRLTPLPPSGLCRPQAPSKRDCVCSGRSAQWGPQNQLRGGGCSWGRDQTADPGQRWGREADAGTPEPELGLLPFQALMLVYSHDCRPRGTWGARESRSHAGPESPTCLGGARLLGTGGLSPERQAWVPPSSRACWKGRCVPGGTRCTPRHPAAAEHRAGERCQLCPPL